MDAGARVIHVDVMDGHFVPPISFGALIVDALRDQVHEAGGWLDVHLMVDRPERQVPSFAEAGADSINVHVEATPHIRYALDAVRDAGCQAGLALNPGTPAEAVVPRGRHHRPRAVHDRQPRLGRPGLHPGLRAQGRAPARAAGRGHADHRGRRHRRRARPDPARRRAPRCSWPAPRCSAATIPAPRTARWPRQPARSELEVRRARSRRSRCWSPAAAASRKLKVRFFDDVQRGREVLISVPEDVNSPGTARGAAQVRGPVLRSPVAHGDERALPLALRGRRHGRPPPPRPPARAAQGSEPGGPVPDRGHRSDAAG